MGSLQERLLEMETNPRRRNRGQVPSEVVASALKFQREFVHAELAFNTTAISDCSESLEMLRLERREAQENRDMMWEDHYAARINTELARMAETRAKKLAQQTATLSQLPSEKDKWNMAIELRMLEYLDDSLSRVDHQSRLQYFASFQKSGQTPLHRACRANDADLVQLLLSLGADLTVRDQAGKSVFHVLAEHKLAKLFHTTVLRLTETSRSILLQVDNSGNSLLHIAAANGSGSILEQLLSEPYQMSMQTLIDLKRTVDRNTALHLAALHGHQASVEMLIVAGHADTAAVNAQGSNPLHLALQQTFDVDKLINVFMTHTESSKRDDTFNTLDESTGQNSLHTTVLKGFLDLTLLLIREQFAQLNTTTRDGCWSPLHLAVMTGALPIVKALLEAGAIVDMGDADGQTPLLLACLGGRLEIVRLLIDHRANPAHQNKQAHSALHYLAAFCRDRQLLEDIIAAGADVNAKSLKLNTPMHFAAMNGNEVATQVLLANGASPSVINEDKRSVVFLAKKWRHRGVEDLVKPPEQPQDGAATPQPAGGRPPVTPKVFPPTRHPHFPRSAIGSARPKWTGVSGMDNDDPDAGSFFDLEDDDEQILSPSHPWPAGGGNNGTPSFANCQKFADLGSRFMDRHNTPRSPLKPVVVSQERRFQRQSLGANRAGVENSAVPGQLKLTRTTSRFLPGPVEIPWEMTVPVSLASETPQRTLKPCIRVHMGLLRDHLTHTRVQHWPDRGNHRSDSAPSLRS